MTLSARSYLAKKEWSYASIGRPRLRVGCSAFPLPFTYEDEGIIWIGYLATLFRLHNLYTLVFWVMTP